MVQPVGKESAGPANNKMRFSDTMETGGGDGISYSFVFLAFEERSFGFVSLLLVVVVVFGEEDGSVVPFDSFRAWTMT